LACQIIIEQLNN